MEVVKSGNELAPGTGISIELHTGAPALPIKFNTGTIEVPIIEANIGGHTVKSISRIMPVGNTLLIAEYGEVGMLKLLNAIETNQGVETNAKLMVVGISSASINQFPLGSHILIKNKDQYAIRPTYDFTNDYSFEKLGKLAREDKSLLAAVSISRNKENSKVGLRMESETIPSETLAKLDKNKSMGSLLYKDKVLPFLNYKLIDCTNVDAVIYANDTAE